jgi:ABC-type glycerol-3-phosphate transport system permease component
MLSGMVIMIPQFIMFKNFGWLNSYLPLIVPTFTGNAFNIFLLRQFFRTIPMELSESAKIDGCHEFRTFVQIILPLCKSALVTIAIFSFMGTWNDFIGPLFYINDKMAFTLSFGLRTFQMQSGTQWHLMMAATVVVVVPTLIVFFCSQNFFIEGITITGIKE